MLFYSVTVKFFLWVALLQIQLSELGFISVLAQKPNRLPNARSFRYRPLQPPADSLVPPPSVASVTEARLPENSSGTQSDLLSEPCTSCSLTMIDTVSAPEAPMVQTVTTTADGDSQEASTNVFEKTDDKQEIVLSVYGPLSEMQYNSFFRLGDIPEVWFDSIAKVATAFRGSWQILLNRSDPVDELMKALGFSMIKRRVMATYSSITDMELIKNDEKSPVIKITTHLPLNNLKQSVVSFDNTWAEQKDSDTGTWRTWSVWMDGRAIQRRESSLGTMFDVRVIFPSDPLSTDSKTTEQAVSGPLMLFKWTFIPTGKQPITAMRWMKKL
ncbi:transmembrane protein [Cystoisospora suis]|uniref:Transmembrane protein n=1 Tax=Cystoisospora suis TaxID=483139 RepID=A0A2C6L3L8_9APIC|nr:transmembrane protein [Cystoisospora suis]